MYSHHHHKAETLVDLYCAYASVQRKDWLKCFHFGCFETLFSIQDSLTAISSPYIISA